MRIHHLKAAVAAVGLATALAACGEAGSETSGGDTPEVEVADDAASEFEDGTRMKELAEAGEVTIGVKYDQPGLGFKDASTDIPTGFDVEIAKLLAADLGIDPESVTWEETISDNREPYLEQGRVDMVLATYSITDDRRKIVGQTGPYLVTGQQVLVPEDSDIESIDDLKGEEVCSATGSTSLENVEASGAQGVPAETYSQCAEDVVNGTVPAMSTDGAILLGLAAQYDGELKVVGEEFSEERIGVGYPKEYPEMCPWINETLEEAYESGAWADAFEATLSSEGVETPEPPALDECQE